MGLLDGMLDQKQTGCDVTTANHRPSGFARETMVQEEEVRTCDASGGGDSTYAGREAE